LKRSFAVFAEKKPVKGGGASKEKVAERRSSGREREIHPPLDVLYGESLEGKSGSGRILKTRQRGEREGGAEKKGS